MKPSLRPLALAGAFLLAPAALSAQQFDAEVARAVERLAPQVTEIRHTIHQNPELSNREVKTAEMVANHLRSLGLEVRTGVAHTGVVGVLRGGRPGPVVAVRADMDALPVTEDTPYPWKSTVRAEYQGQQVGVSHACGHDVHTAVQMGVASILAGMKERVPGTVLFVFQPAEEGVPPGEEGGAEMMLKEGVFSSPKPAAVFGLHTLAQMEVGRIGYTPGPAMASVDRFTIRVRGRQAHGGTPQLGVDPVVIAAQAILALQTIRSRNLSPFEPSVVTVGMVHGGERFNIIPGEVVLTGTVRLFSPDAQTEVERRMREIMDGLSRAGGGSYELAYDRITPVTVNHRELSDRMRPTLERLMGRDNVATLAPTTQGEDFAYFANTVPGFYYRVGTTKPGTTSGDHHTPTFMADDSSIPIAMRAMTTLLLDYLSGQSATGTAPR